MNKTIREREPNNINLDWAEVCYKYIKYLKHATLDNLMNLFRFAISNRADNYLAFTKHIEQTPAAQYLLINKA